MIFPSTYKQFLEQTGLTNLQFLIILIIGFLLLAFVVLLYKMGLLTRIKFHQWTMPPTKVFYLSYDGPYDAINTKFGQVIDDMNKILKFSTLFAIYYDNQAEDENSSGCKAVVGYLVHSAQEGKNKLLNQKFPGKYKQGQIPATRCVSTKYPYFNSMSLIMVITRVYPRLAEFVRQKKLDAGPGILEIYHFYDSKPHIRISAPLENYDEFLLN